MVAVSQFPPQLPAKVNANAHRTIPCLDVIQLPVDTAAPILKNTNDKPIGKRAVRYIRITCNSKRVTLTNFNAKHFIPESVGAIAPEPADPPDVACKAR